MKTFITGIVFILLSLFGFYKCYKIEHTDAILISMSHPAPEKFYAVAKFINSCKISETEITSDIFYNNKTGNNVQISSDKKGSGIIATISYFGLIFGMIFTFLLNPFNKN